MAVDVASAFRNISIHSNSVFLFAGRIEEENAIVIELSAPFGWTGSPGFYEILGGAVSHVHGSHYNAGNPSGFFNYHWVDDRINVAANIGSTLDDMERSLRFAMVAVLGNEAINDEKFTPWKTHQRVLGLEFDCGGNGVHAGVQDRQGSQRRGFGVLCRHPNAQGIPFADGKRQSEKMENAHCGNLQQLNEMLAQIKAAYFELIKLAVCVQLPVPRLAAGDKAIDSGDGEQTTFLHGDMREIFLETNSVR